MSYLFFLVDNFDLLPLITGKPTDQEDKIVSAFDILIERATKGDPQILFSLINDLSKVCNIMELINTYVT